MQRKKSSQPEDRDHGRRVPAVEAKAGLLFCAPCVLGRFRKVYAGKLHGYIFIIKSSCWLQCAEWMEESKFPFREEN